MVERIARVVLFAVLFVIPAQALAGAADANSYFLSGQMGAGLNLGSGGGFDLQIAPRGLYFPMQSLGLGAELDLGYGSQSNFSYTSLAIGPRVAYFVKLEGRRYPRGCCLTPYLGTNNMWMPYGGLSVMFLLHSSKFGSTTSTATGYKARLGVGAAPRIGDRGTAFMEIGFETSKLSGSTSVASSSSGNRLYLEGGFGAFLFR